MLTYTEAKVLSDDLYPLCAPVIKGYSLKTKNWGTSTIISHAR